MLHKIQLIVVLLLRNSNSQNVHVFRNRDSHFSISGNLFVWYLKQYEYFCTKMFTDTKQRTSAAVRLMTSPQYNQIPFKVQQSQQVRLFAELSNVYIYKAIDLQFVTEPLRDGVMPSFVVAKLRCCAQPPHGCCLFHACKVTHAHDLFRMLPKSRKLAIVGEGSQLS